MDEHILLRDRNHHWSVYHSSPDRTRQIIDGQIEQGQGQFTGILIAPSDNQGDLSNLAHKLNQFLSGNGQITPYNELSPKEQEQAKTHPGILRLASVSG